MSGKTLLRPEVFREKVTEEKSLKKNERGIIDQKLDDHLKEQIVSTVGLVSADLSEALSKIEIDYRELKNKSLDEVVSTHIFPQFKKDEKLAEEIRSLEGKFTRADSDKVSDVLHLNEPIEENPLLFEEVQRSRTFELGKIAQLSDTKINKLLERNTALDSAAPSEWEELEREGYLTKKQRYALKYTVSLAKLTGENFKLVEKLHTQGKSIRDFVKWEKQDWVKFLKSKKIDPPRAESLEKYADNIVFNLERTYPSHFLLHRVITSIDSKKSAGLLNDVKRLFTENERLIENRGAARISWKGVGASSRKKMKESLDELVSLSNTYRYLGISDIINDTSLSVEKKRKAVETSISRLQLFYNNNPDVDLRFIPFFNSSNNGGKEVFNWKGITSSDQPKIRKQLMSYQRVMSLSDETAATQKLLSNGLDNAITIADMTFEKFQRSSGLGTTQAKLIYANANEKSLQLTQDFGFIQDSVYGLFKDIFVGNVYKKLVNDLKDVDGFADLFGSQNFCECEHCRSIFSPAAYFVDLMRFIEKNVSDEVFANKTNHPIYLKRRRPDLWNLRLTCENTTTLIPYLNVVNDVLEQYLDQVTPGSDIYKKLSEENISVSLPINLPLEEMRIYLSHFNSTLHEINKTLKKPDEDIWREKLKISVEELNIITTPDASGVKKRFGNPSVQVMKDFDVQDFIRIAGMSREELDVLLNIKFFSELNIVKIIQKQKEDELQIFEEKLNNLTDQRLDKVHRFMRFRKKLPWTINELDLVLGSLKDSGYANDLNKDAVLIIGELVDIQEKLKLSVEELCSMFHLLPEIRIEEDKESLFIRLFDPESLFEGANNVIYHHSYFNVNNPNDKTIDSRTPILLSGLGVSETELLLLLDFLKNEMSFNNDGECTFDRGKISLLFRHSKISKSLKLKVEDLTRIIRFKFLQSGSFIDSLDRIHDLISFRNWLKSSPFSVSELWFILTGEEAGTLKYKKDIYAVSSLVQSIQDNQLLYLTPDALTQVDGVGFQSAKAILEQMKTDGLLLSSIDGESYRLTASYQLNQSFAPIFIAIDAEASITAKEGEIRDAVNNFHPSSVLSKSLASMFNITREMFEALTHFIGTSITDNAFFTALDASFTDGIPDNPADLDPLFDFVKPMERLDVLIDNLKMKEEDVVFVTDNEHVFKITDPKALTLGNIYLLAFYKKLSASTDLNASLRSVFKNYQSSSTFGSEDIAILADLWKQDGSLIQSLIDSLNLPSNSLLAIEHIWEGLKICKLLGINGYSLQKLTVSDFDGLKNARDIVLGAFGSKYENEDMRTEKIEPYKDRVNVLKRDSLCDYILAREKELKFKDKNDLYGFFLLDVEMGGCFRTSRIVAAISSLQLYIHRCLINLEQSATDNTKVDPALIPQEEWEWMKNYRVWEANRKVFLYPENYILPDLRDNKTPPFKDLEDELLQEKITKESAESAYKNYLTKFAEVAKLKISGSIYHEDTSTYYFFGHTPTDPPQFYYRQLISNKEWTPWTKIELGINAEYASAIVYLGKVFIFWVEANYQEKSKVKDGSSESPHFEYKINLQYSYLNENGDWAPPQRLENLYPYNPALFFSENDLDDFEDYKTYNKTYPYIKGGHINLIYYGGPELKYRFDRQLDLFTNKLTSGPSPNKLSKKNIVKLFTLSSKAAIGLKKNSYDYESGVDIGYTHNKQNLTLLTNEFSYNEYQPDFTIVHNKFGDFVFELGKQHFLIKENDYYLGGSGIYQIIILSLFKRSMLRLSTSIADRLADTLFNEGIDKLLNLNTQKEKEKPLNISFTHPSELSPPYDNTEHLDFKGSYGVYYRELFFDIPFLIAYHANANQKFKVSKYWYEKIFNPTASETPEPAKPTDRNWRYIEFRDLDVPKMRDILTDKKTINAYKKDPFNPHAIARLRLSAYQKTIVMKYIDNLLDWGDYLFAQDTMESINEATILYIFAYDILGKRPVKLGECKTVSEDKLTYEQLGPVIDKGSEFLIELENWSWGNNIIQAAQEYNIIPQISTEMSTIASGTVVSSSTPSNIVASAGDSVFSLAVSDMHDRAYDYHMHDYSDTVAMRDKRKAVQDSMKPQYELRPVPGLGITKQKSTLAFCVPPNEDLLKYWDRVEDRLFKIRNCMNISGVRRALALFQPPIDPMLLVKAKAAGLSLEDILAALQEKPPAYRFSFLIGKAKEFTSTVQSFGNSLLSALEKKDVEELTRLNNIHRQAILNIVKEAKKQQLKEAIAQLDGTRAVKQNVQNRIDHYNSLIEEGLTGWEIGQQVSKHVATGFKIAEGTLHLLGVIHYLIPQMGSPFAMKYGGKELGDSITESAAMLASFASVADSMSSSAGLEATFQRREEEWNHQLTLANQEMVKMVQDEIVAEARVDITTNELNVHEEEVSQAEELEDFYKNKFTNLGLYNYLSVSLNRLYRESYNMAHDLAKMAERAYRFERDDDNFFIANDNWQYDRAGLLAGERLMLQLHRLEKAYLENNQRDYEITQSFSMLQIDPSSLLELRETGKCENFSIPEIAFDLFYPGQYKRITKSVSLTIPSVSGPYTNIGCKLTLLDSKVRKEPSLESDLISVSVQKLSSVATSRANNDSGLFELNFRDERYLPFEGSGAISAWKIELPAVIRPFDYDSMSDVIFTISYSAKDDGLYREKVEEGLSDILMDYATTTGLFRLFSLRHEFPNSYHKLLNPAGDIQETAFKVESFHFPYLFSGMELNISEVKVFLKLKEGEEMDTSGLTIKINNISVTNWSDLHKNIKEGTVNISGNPFKEWTIKNEGDFLDIKKLEDIYLYIKYTAEEG